MTKDDCIFCKLANGVIPTNTVYEDDAFRVILDAGPATKGHSLIIPKDHFADLFEIDENTVASAMKLAKKMAAHMKEKLHCDGFNLVQNNGECAGQTVFHFHLHLIPRYENDGAGILWTPGKPDDDAQKKLCEELKF